MNHTPPDEPPPDAPEGWVFGELFPGETPPPDPHHREPKLKTTGRTDVQDEEAGNGKDKPKK